MKNLYYDVVIAGCGVAGLYAALNLPEEMNILMLSKKDLESCDSMLAQGGICIILVSVLQKIRMEALPIPGRELIPGRGSASMRILPERRSQRHYYHM